ncbi:hypothetical protein HMPREF9303_0638 [Prevotella denticola CRIS 18C-A]|uniref:Uncharacterized protein n=1 Tax=Prevotella denticola CRIS 18C-A TaxID=944557 RepID=F0H8G2_9BACT|nr:hypothetical protein HMPREF9303_0638 [Prevotella denticola CRIS 18C-A]KGF41410.1 hypothetical protein HMPREF2139_05700 [Prevotella denticola DNF00960]
MQTTHRGVPVSILPGAACLLYSICARTGIDIHPVTQMDVSGTSGSQLQIYTKKKEETNKKRKRFAISAFSFTFASGNQRQRNRYEMSGM